MRIARSLKFRIFLLVMLVGTLPCVILGGVIVRSYESRAVSLRTSTVRNQCTVLANHLLNYGYLEDTSIETVNAELEQLSNIYDGRVLIMNRDYKVIKDTYGISEGKYMISEEVVKAFAKENVSRYDDENGFIEVTTPIVSETTDTSSSGGANEGEVVGVMLTSVTTEEINETINMMHAGATIVFVIAVVLIIVHAYISSSRIVRPFNGISNAIDNIQEGFDEREIYVNDYLETERITDAFNHMLGRIKLLDDSRQEFVSNVSHELKTPITSMKVLADSLLSQGDDVPADVYREFMEDIVHEIDRENDIINDLLTLVRMDKKGATLVAKECNIEELLNLIIKRLRPIADQKNVEIIFEKIRDVSAEVDETKISLAFTNLIENAIKYNVDGGKVHIKLDAEPLIFTLEVTDTGIGIPQEDIPQIFERFYRVDKSHSREIGGNGLGLAIVRNAIVMHKGAIRVESQVDKGTTFTVKIPMSYIMPGDTHNENA